MSGLLSRLRNLAADVLMLYVVPCGTALLPWKCGFALLKRLARSERVYRLAIEPAWSAARTHCPDCDEAEWKYRFRLLRLVDHADVYLTLLRGARWRHRHIVEAGTWPAPGPCVFLTCHWGAGGWLWPRLREHGFDAHFIARRAEGRALGMTRLSHRFGAFRAWALRRIGSAGPIFTGSSADAIASALRAGRSIVGMLDLPARSDQQAAVVPVLDGFARLPSGLLRIAEATNSPIALITCGLNPDSGQRDIRIETLAPDMSPEQIMRRYAAHLDTRLREAPAYWQIWREAPAIFVASTEKDADGPAQGLE